jgi:hypothetical protein
VQTSNMKLGKCPYCGATTARDDLGLYHEQPTCKEWSAEMAKQPVRYAGTVNAIVVQVSEKPKPEGSSN